MEFTGRSLARLTGRSALWILALIHLVLPFTPVNSHPEAQIKIAAVAIGSVFLALAVVWPRAPRAASAAGLVLFIAISSVAAATQRSPIEEGWVVKLFFVVSLALAFASFAPSARESRRVVSR